MTYTRDEIMAMDEDALRIAVATALGIAVPQPTLRSSIFEEFERWPLGAPPDEPNWPSNIRYAYELESQLPETKRERYAWNLYLILNKRERESYKVTHHWQLIHASAADRCRAWLMTMGEG